MSQQESSRASRATHERKFSLQVWCFEGWVESFFLGKNGVMVKQKKRHRFRRPQTFRMPAQAITHSFLSPCAKKNTEIAQILNFGDPQFRCNRPKVGNQNENLAIACQEYQYLCSRIHTKPIKEASDNNNNQTMHEAPK